MIWIVRDYMAAMYTAVGGILLICIILLFLVRRGTIQWTWRKTISACLVVFFTYAVAASLMFIKLYSHSQE